MFSRSIKKTFRPTFDVLDARCLPSSLGFGRPHGLGEVEHAHLRRHGGGEHQIQVQHHREVEHGRELESGFGGQGLDT
jgi:hypothetical protein